MEDEDWDFFVNSSPALPQSSSKQVVRLTCCPLGWNSCLDKFIKLDTRSKTIIFEEVKFSNLSTYTTLSSVEVMSIFVEALCLIRSHQALEAINNLLRLFVLGQHFFQSHWIVAFKQAVKTHMKCQGLFVFFDSAPARGCSTISSAHHCCALITRRYIYIFFWQWLDVSKA